MGLLILCNITKIRSLIHSLFCHVFKMFPIDKPLGRDQGPDLNEIAKFLYYSSFINCKLV